ncbi:MAG: NAD(P)H-dependent oxidoreductase [Alcanivorax sp.]|nr:NAD(P)H-dependent oxidoreductase [Alcanivorax sp.]
MTRILHLDASARPGRAGIDAHGSHTRSLTDHFVCRWLAARPDDEVIYRDVGATPPSPVSHAWIEAAFAPESAWQPWMADTLAESDALVDELVAADILVLGVPLYNFSAPSAFKAWIDNVIRLGRTVAYDASNPEAPFTPLLSDRPRAAVLLSSRGGHGMEPGGAYAHMNHLEPSVRTALEFMGIETLHTAAVEHQEDGGELLAASVKATLQRTEAVVDDLLRMFPATTSTAKAARQA